MTKQITDRTKLITKEGTDDQTSSPHKSCFATKQISKVLELSSNSRIIAFPSVLSKNGRIEWYKIGGNSAYYYKYIIAPRLNKKPPTKYRPIPYT